MSQHRMCKTDNNLISESPRTGKPHWRQTPDLRTAAVQRNSVPLNGAIMFSFGQKLNLKFKLNSKEEQTTLKGKRRVRTLVRRVWPGEGGICFSRVSRQCALPPTHLGFHPPRKHTHTHTHTCTHILCCHGGHEEKMRNLNLALIPMCKSYRVKRDERRWGPRREFRIQGIAGG